MAKVKNPLLESKQIKNLIYTKRKSENDGFTHNVKTARVKSRKKKTR